jgi:hypothetical protein
VNGSPALRIFRQDGDESSSTAEARVSLGDVLRYLQLAVTNFDVLGFTSGAVINLSLLISLFHQPKPKIEKSIVYMKNPLPVRVRISRFIEERYLHRDKSHSFPELALLGIIVIIAVWPMLSAASAMNWIR